MSSTLQRYVCVRGKQDLLKHEEKNVLSISAFFVSDCAVYPSNFSTGSVDCFLFSANCPESFGLRF